MSKIFKNLIPYWKSVIMILLLLFVQAWCDLSLPQYTSDIIDVGIQNQGIEHVLPESVTANEYSLAELFMTTEEKNLWENSYEKDNETYERKTLTKEELEKADDTLALPLALAYQMSAIEEDTFKETIAAQMGTDAETLKDVTIEQIGQQMGIPLTSFEREKEDDNGNTETVTCVDMRVLFQALLSNGMMPQQNITSIRKEMEESMEAVGDTMLKSVGLAYAIQ